jgi:hypothetical protein
MHANSGILILVSVREQPEPLESSVIRLRGKHSRGRQTLENRVRYDCSRLRYPSELTVGGQPVRKISVGRQSKAGEAPSGCGNSGTATAQYCPMTGPSLAASSKMLMLLRHAVTASACQRGIRDLPGGVD